MIVADAARITAAAWILIVVIVSARPMLLGDALTLSFDIFHRNNQDFVDKAEKLHKHIHSEADMHSLNNTCAQMKSWQSITAAASGAITAYWPSTAQTR